jgi:hypothetical protein
MENFINDFLRFSQAIIIPALIFFASYVKKQADIQRDISDLKTYTLAICKELKITCTLKDG